MYGYDNFVRVLGVCRVFTLLMVVLGSIPASYKLRISQEITLAEALGSVNCANYLSAILYSELNPSISRPFRLL